MFWLMLGIRIPGTFLSQVLMSESCLMWLPSESIMVEIVSKTLHPSQFSQKRKRKNEELRVITLILRVLDTFMDVAKQNPTETSVLKFPGET